MSRIVEVLILKAEAVSLFTTQHVSVFVVEVRQVLSSKVDILHSYVAVYFDYVHHM